MKYKVNMLYPDGTEDLQDEVFDTEDEAREYGCEMCSYYADGAEILNMSNPGEYPYDESESADYEIIEVDE